MKFIIMSILFIIGSIAAKENDEKQSWDGGHYKENSYFQYKGGITYIGQVDLSRFKRICDLGCGPGTITKYIAQKAPDCKIVGVDPDLSMFEEARKLEKDCANVSIVQGAAENYRAEEPFDLIFSNAVFHWVWEQQKALNLQRQNLSKNGELHIIMSAKLPDNYPMVKALSIVTNSPRWKKYFEKLKGQKLHNACLKEELEKMLYLAGFDNVMVTEIDIRRRFKDFETCKNWIKGFAGGTRGVSEMSDEDQTEFARDITEQLLLESQNVQKEGICADSKALIAVAKVLK